jgi:hypothetical protein
MDSFGSRRIYYNNFASHLLNAYNPNMLYPQLRHRWSNEQWTACIDMVSDFGFNAFEFWLEPRLFCREGLEEPYGKEFASQMDFIIEYVHKKDMKVALLCSLATTGSNWHTLCPNDPDGWAEIIYLWRAWLTRLSEIDILSMFPGDPGACSLNGCTAETYIDRSCDIALLAKTTANCEVEFGTWGPPYFGWGILEGPEGWDGSFHPEYQETAWKFDRSRSDRSMEHLLKRLLDFPKDTSVAINLGFNPDGNPDDEADATGWIDAIAKTNNVYTWDFSLTEGENAITPHWRFDRLYSQRRKERATNAISGGICFTMTPLLNQLSLYQAARSFTTPDSDPVAVAIEYFEAFFGSDAHEIVECYPVFELVQDWGYYSGDLRPLPEVHEKAKRLVQILSDASVKSPPYAFICDPETYRKELLFYARIFADLSDDSPDFDALTSRFWDRVYAIYDDLPTHVDPRPKAATKRFIEMFSSRSGL